ncbi:MAG: response regulator [Actinomycetota bacterium]|nr:response regulator [Actinomycetota bacterium]
MVAIFAVLLVVPLVALTFLSVRLAGAAVHREVIARLETTAAVAAEVMSQQMEGLRELAVSYAERPNLIEALGNGDPSRFDRRTVEYHIRQLSEARPGIGTAFIADDAGKLLAIYPATPSIIGDDFSYRDWYRGVTAGDGAYLSEAYTSAASGNPTVVAAAAPIYALSPTGERGNRVGIIVAAYTTDTVKSFAQEVARAQRVQLTVADQSGTVIAGHPDTSAAADKQLEAALDGRSGVGEHPDEGGELSAYSPVPSIGWAVVADVPADSALEAISSMRATVYSVAGLLGVVLVAGLVLLALTLREREVAERTIRQSGEQMRKMLDAAEDVFVAVGTDGRITGWNKRAEHSLGWLPDEILGQHLDVVMPAPLNDDIHRLLPALSASDGVSQRVEARVIARDGTSFPAEISLWSSPVEAGAALNMFVRDISERRRVEEQLELARTRAIEASKLKSEFLANMSHEIRTPMNGVMGMTSLLRGTDLSAEQREYAETIHESAENLLTVINDILDFSKIEAGKLEIESIDFDVRAVIEGVGDLMAERAHAKGLELANLIHPEVPHVVKGDPGRLRQVLFNLVGNAIKFTDAGEVVSAAMVTETTGDEVTLRFEVVDTGIGIAPDDQVRLFESFSQADASSTRVYGGTGLGLAISQQLVGLMKGRIGLESHVGEGSRFWFELPFEKSARADVAIALDRSRVRGRRVLVVDDNATNRKILEQNLHAWGVRADLAASGGEALTLLRGAVRDGRSYDLALLDYHMPEMDGIELAQVMAKDMTLRPTKIILLSSGADRREIEAAGSVISAYLTKPIRQSPLYDVMAAALADEDASDRRTLVTEHVVERARSGGRKRILVVEDNPVNQKVAARMLERLGHRVDMARDGREAVEAVGRTRYSAVLMDCQMPNMDGYEATRRIRAQEGIARHTPIIALTAAAMLTDQEQALAAGMDAYISKPVDLARLEAALDRAMGLDGGPTDAGSDPLVPDGAEEAEASILDPNVIAELQDLDERAGGDFFEGFVEEFLRQGDARLAELGAAMEPPFDDAEVHRLSHTLRGGCAAMGAVRAARLCGKLEVSNDPEESRATLTLLQSELALVGERLSQLLSA